MPDAGSAVRVTTVPVQDVAHTMKAARLLYSAPSYVLRGPIYLIFIITFSALIYSFYAPVNDVVTCPNLELKADITKIQSPKSGTVAAIHVNEEDVVKAFRNLIDLQLKTGAAESEVDAIQDQIDKFEDKKKMIKEGKEIKQQRITNLNTQIKDSQDRNNALEDDIKKEDQLFQQQLERSGKDVPIIELDLQNALADIKKTEESLRTRRQEEADADKALKAEEALLPRGLTTVQAVQGLKTQFGQKHEAVILTDNTLGQQKEKVNQVKLKLNDLQKEPLRLQMEQERKKGDRDARRARIREEIASFKNQIAEIELAMKQSEAEVQIEIDRLRAKKEETARLMPNVRLDGQKATVFTQYGGKINNVFVKPDQPIARGDPMFGIWRETEVIYAEIYIQNVFMGRVMAGMKKFGKLEVSIKYGAYPYQEYGIKKGQIVWISEKPSSEVTGHQTDYKAKVELKGLKELGPFAWSHKSPDGKDVPMTLGLVGMAEIKTGEKRLIETIFTPISKWMQGE